MFYHLCFTNSSNSFLSFFRQPLSKLAERNSAKSDHMLGSELKMHVRNLRYPIFLQIEGPENHLFQRLHNLAAILTAYIFGTKQDIDNRVSVLTTTWGLLHCLKMS